jgi:pimeloyl-ACP methyl ester carboxylesterase
MKKKKNEHEKSVKILCLALVLILFGSFFAFLLQTSFFTVNVKDIYLPTNRQQYLHAQMFTPASASKENPCPLIIACHGWMDNAQLLDAWCIELSRRGVAVISMDAYSHGLSSNVPENIIIDSRINDGLGLIAAVEYATSGIMDFIDMSKIGLMGHSMGGSAIGGTMTYYGTLYTEAVEAAKAENSDGGTVITEAEQAYCDTLYPITSILSVGNCDETVSSCFETLKCNFGVLISSNEAENDPTEFVAGIDMLMATIGVTSYEPDQYYGNAGDGTLRVYYVPFGTHPLDTFLPNITADVLEYWNTAWNLDTTLGVYNQTYLIKEFCNLIALIGLIMLLVPLADLLLKVPCFANLRGTEGPMIPTPAGRRKTRIVLSIILCVLVSFGTCVASYLFFDTDIFGTLFPAGMVANTYFFSATAMNPILIMTGLSTIFLVFWFRWNYKRDKKDGICNSDMIGWKIKPREFWKTLGLAVTIIGIIYVIVFFCYWLFKTDFRLWKVSIQAFNAGKLWTYIQYVPFFFVFYLVVALFVNGFLRFEGMTEKKNLLLCTFANSGGVILFFIVQYVGLFIKGHLYTIEADWGVTVWIIMCGWQLMLAPYLLRKFYQITGKNWLGPLVVSSLFVLSTVANTAISCYLF